MEERMLGRAGEIRMKRVRKMEKDEEGERGKTTECLIFPFCQSGMHRG